MAVLAKIEQFGDDLGIILPDEVLAHLNAKLDDTLEFVMTRDGLLLKLRQAQYEEKMAALGHVTAENWDVLKMLADS